MKLLLFLFFLFHCDVFFSREITRDILLREDVKTLIKKNPNIKKILRKRMKRPGLGKKMNRRLGIKKGRFQNAPSKKEDNHRNKDQFLKKDLSHDTNDDEKNEKVLKLKNFFDMALPNLSRYYHIYEYIFLMMSASFSFKNNIKTFTKEKEIRSFLIEKSNQFIGEIKKIIDFDKNAIQGIINDLVFFQNNKFENNERTDAYIYIGESMYDAVEKHDLARFGNTKFLKYKNNKNDLAIRAFVAQSQQSTKEIFFSKLFSQFQKESDIFLFEYLKIVFFVYAYAVGLEEGFISEKDFFGAVIKNTENQKDLQKKNIHLVKSALRELVSIINGIGGFVSSDKEDSSLGDALKRTIIEIETREQEQKNKFSTYVKMALMGTAYAAGLFFLSRYNGPTYFGANQLVDLQNYIPSSVSNIAQITVDSIKNSLFFWRSAPSWKSFLYKGLTFGIGDKMLQSIHKVVDVGIEHIGKSSENKMIEMGSSFFLGAGLNYYVDSWFTGYFVSLFGEKAAKIFNFSLFNEARNKILDFIYNSKSFYNFDIADLPGDASLILTEAYMQGEYVKGLLMAIMAEQQSHASNLISTFKTWVLDRFL
jgi:hypothetical protein